MKLKPIQFIVFVIWGALCIGQVVLAFVVTVQDGTQSENPQASLFALIAGAISMLTFVFRHFMLSDFRTGRRSLDTPDGQHSYLVGNITIFASCESIGILGFVNGLTNRGAVDSWLPFIGGALILLLIHIPLPSRFEPQVSRI
jgi:hypothetical protein